MPRVHTKKAATRKYQQRDADKGRIKPEQIGTLKPNWKCVTCNSEIKPGDKYHEWSFRYGGTYRSCELHYPKPSQLTQSLMSSVYAAQEDFDPSNLEIGDIEGLRDEVQQVIDAATEVKDQYEEAAEAFGGAGENAERAEQLDSWISDMESWDSSIDSDPGEDDQEEAEPASITVWAIREKQKDGTWLDLNSLVEGDWYESEEDAKTDIIERLVNRGFPAETVEAEWSQYYDIEEKEVADPDAEESEEDDGSAREEWWESVIDAAQTVVDECPL